MSSVHQVHRGLSEASAVFLILLVAACGPEVGDGGRHHQDVGVGGRAWRPPRASAPRR